MEKGKNFNEWRAEKLGYVYFSRLNDLIINEPNFQQSLFNYLIDIGEDHRHTGRLFGVEVKAMNGKAHPDKSFEEQYKNITFPALLVMFDNTNDHGYFKWIKKPKEDGRLVLDKSKKNLQELNDAALQEIVREIKEWYSNQQQVA